ncbi:MAG: stage III sporulation protein AD [Bacillota bacterium]|jgi:stage III sporulation protein AD
MEIIPIVGLAITATVLLIVLRQSRPEFALILSILVGTLIFLSALPKIGMVVSTMNSIASKVEIGSLQLGMLLKIVGVAYITEFGAQICRDANESAIAGKVELAGKVIIMVLAVPIVLVILDTVLGLLP